MAEQLVMIEEGSPQDAQGVLSLIKEAADETDYITGVESILHASPEQLEVFLARSQDSVIDFCLLAKLDNKVIGLLNLSGEVTEQKQVQADLFMLVTKSYRGYGIGQLLLEVALDWAWENPYVMALQLEVQVRNSRAIHLYEKYGFRVENIQKKDVKSKEGDDLDVYRMRNQLSQEVD
ncbi:N-acetyltransferase family protein [Streptococcus castoreus]|uniref:GNAT family N-acetyltransferase n=1 Tax=Streptococcus castoreus TaxID=254786 RepID=UPI000483D8BD|nr:N-acetyltransferase [Streptococcus castoreus]